jgi:hypothetical protein
MAVMDACFAVLVDSGLRSAGDWKRLARALPICSGKPDKVERRIRAIEARYPKDERRQASVALIEWRTCHGDRATVGSLVAALRRCNLREEIVLVEQFTLESAA